MRKLLLTALLGILMAVPAGMEAAAQDFEATPVEISADKVNISGNVYFIHKVLKGHTLYSISKAYGVSIDTIMQANPSLSEGLKAGMLIYIPESAASADKKTETATVAVPTENTVRQSVEPEQGDRQTGKTAQDRKSDRPSGKKYKKYNVKWYETLDDVAVKFNVPTGAIIALNGIDTNSGKRIRSVLIPDEEYLRTYREDGEQADGLADGDNAEETGSTSETYKAEDGQGAWINSGKPEPSSYFSHGTHVISLVMPFNASRNASGINSYTADFYAGILTAMADLKERGMFSGFVLNVIDMSRYSSAWELVASEALRGSELIIGPITERDMQPIAAYARSREIPVVSPLDLKTATLVEGNPWFFLFPPQSDLALQHQIDKIAASIRQADTTEYVTVIYEQGYERSDMVVQTMSSLGAKGIPFKTFKYDFLSGRGIDTVMVHAFDRHLVNRVIIPSMSEAFITDALRNLSLIRNSGIDIEVYGMSRWKSFETIELDYFHALDLRLAMSYYIDYNSPETKDFINKYTAAFHTEPTSFAFQGYDILTFFVEAMSKWGKNFPQAIVNERKSLIQSDVLFLPAGPGSGYVNCAFKDICFTDGWTVTEE